ncbi:MAG: transglutaminase domain-containing protein [Myxococcales bacterium]|nr:transglutaminase domain-containing protein [Myxococcales bacterium]
MRSRQKLRFVGQCATFALMSLLVSGCIPSFKGFQPVTQRELQPLGSKRTMPDAEILWMESEYYHRWGQVGQSRRTTFWRMNKRIRINKAGGLKYASFKYLPGAFAVWSPFNKLNKFSVRATCPGGRTLNFDDRALKLLRVKFYDRSADAVETVIENQVFHSHLPGVEVGCVLDVMWEYDLSMQFNRFFFGLTGVRIDLMDELPIRKAHMRYYYAENLEMRMDLDPLFILEYLQQRQGLQRINNIIAEIKALIEKLPDADKGPALNWIKGLKLPGKKLMAAVFERLTPEMRLVSLRTFPKLSPKERASVIARLRVSSPESAEKLKGSIDPNKPMAMPKNPDDKTRLNIEIERAIRAALVADEADKEGTQDAVRVAHDRSARTIDVYLNNVPSMSRRGRRRLLAVCKRAALPPRYCNPPRATMKIVRMFDTRMAVYQDIRAEWKNIVAWYTRAMWPFQDDRSGFSRNFQMDEDQELNQSGLPKIARELTQNASSREEKIKILYEHLRLNMYVQGAIGLAPINFGLSSGNDLLRNYQLRTGNPYVSNMLFLVMLRSLGIRAYAALMPYGNYTYRKGLPDRDVFRGLSIFIPDESEGPWRGLGAERAADASKFRAPGKERTVDKGRILNPAEIVYPYGTLSPLAEGIEAFVIDYGGGRFFKVPEHEYTFTQDKSTYDIQVDADGTVTGSYSVVMTGHRANQERRMLLFAQPRDWENWRKRRGAWLRQLCGPQVEITDIKLPELNIKDPSQPLTYQYKYKAPHCFPHSDKVMLYKTPGTLPGYQFNAPDREIELFFDYPYIKSSKITMRFPAAFKLGLNLRQKEAHSGETTSSDNKNFKDAVFLKSSTKIEGTTLTKNTEFQIRKRLLPATDYKEFRKFWKSVAASLRYKIAHK